MTVCLSLMWDCRQMGEVLKVKAAGVEKNKRTA
jgi:hypothetical protein